MAIDNGYVEGASNTSDFFLSVNPYATLGNAIDMKGFKIDDKRFWASIQYVVAAGGATTTITPLTGNQDSGLRYYRVAISDGINTVGGALSLAAPTTPFVINTSSLIKTNEWTIYFAGATTDTSFGGGDEPLTYKKELEQVGVSGVTGNTIPTDWVNVQMLLKLTSTDDADFTLFPAAGLLINNGDAIDLLEYLSSGTELTKTKSYVFSLEGKRIGSAPVTAAVSLSNTDVITSKTAAVAFPYTFTQSFVPLYTAVTIKTSASGAKSSVQTFALTNEGVVPSFVFTMTDTISA